MKTELYNAIKSINPENLIEEDKKELLKIFWNVKNDLIRDRIAFILSDAGYARAIPYILKKILNKANAHNNSSLVQALDGFDLRKYVISIVRIICTQEYEPRMIAYGHLMKMDIGSNLPLKATQKALELLNFHKAKLLQQDAFDGEESTIHFIEKTIQLLHL